ncbi:MAG: hypothetical protein HZA32_21390 [Opitutae bacterium]|nr:hypothetical protein [Opitutae bacterium]
MDKEELIKTAIIAVVSVSFKEVASWLIKRMISMAVIVRETAIKNWKTIDVLLDGLGGIWLLALSYFAAMKASSVDGNLVFTVALMVNFAFVEFGRFQRNFIRLAEKQKKAQQAATANDAQRT